MRVSIIIPTYNSARTIQAAIASATAQTERDIEILVADNCSTDDTFEIAKHLSAQDSRIRAFRTPANGGPSVSRNLALSNACGDWIAILDSDDRYHPTRLATLLALGERSGADFVADNLRICDEGGAPLNRSLFSPETVTEPRPISFIEFMEHALGRRGVARGVSWVGLKPVWRRAFLDRTNIRYDENVWWGEDYLIYLASVLNGAALWVTPEPLYDYVVRPGSLTDNPRLEDLRRIVEADRALLAHDWVVHDLRLQRAVKRHQGVHHRWLEYQRFAETMNSGHVMEAALLMVRSRTIMRTIAAHALLDSMAYLQRGRGIARHLVPRRRTPAWSP